MSVFRSHLKACLFRRSFPWHLLYSFCSACAVTVVIFRHFNHSFFTCLLTYLVTALEYTPDPHIQLCHMRLSFPVLSFTVSVIGGISCGWQSMRISAGNIRAATQFGQFLPITVVITAGFLRYPLPCYSSSLCCTTEYCTSVCISTCKVLAAVWLLWWCVRVHSVSGW